MHPKFRGANSLIWYGLIEGSCVIPNKAVYMDDDIWSKLVKMLAPAIRKMTVSSFSCMCPILLNIYLNIHLCSTKLSTYMIHGFPE